MATRPVIATWVAAIFTTGTLIGYLTAPVGSSSTSDSTRTSPHSAELPATHPNTDPRKTRPPGSRIKPQVFSTDKYGNLHVPSGLFKDLHYETELLYQGEGEDWRHRIGLDAQQSKAFLSLVREVEAARHEREKASVQVVEAGEKRTVIRIPPDPEDAHGKGALLDRLHGMLRPNQEAAETLLSLALGHLTGNWGTETTYVEATPGEKGIGYHVWTFSDDRISGLERAKAGFEDIQNEAERENIYAPVPPGQAPPDDIRHLFAEGPER